MIPSHLEFHNGRLWTAVEKVQELREGERIRFVDSGGRVVEDDEGCKEFLVSSSYGRDGDSGIVGLGIDPA